MRNIFRKTHKQILLDLLPKNSIGAEIGVWKGEFSKQIIKKVKPKELVLIDPWEFNEEHVDRIYGGKIAKSQKDMDIIYNKIEKLRNKNNAVKILKDYSENALNKFNDSYFDWVYIDGNHSYEFVMKDLEISMKKVKERGLITGDDYKNGNQVKTAVDDFVEKHKLNLLITGNQFIIKI